MKPINIAITGKSPMVELNSDISLIKIKGKSMMENASEFYRRIKEWITDYLTEGFETVRIELEFDYVNSSSTKQLLQLFYLFEDNNYTDKVKVIWYYKQSNELILEMGEEMQLMTDLQIELTVC